MERRAHVQTFTRALSSLLLISIAGCSTTRSSVETDNSKVVVSCVDPRIEYSSGNVSVAFFEHQSGSMKTTQRDCKMYRTNAQASAARGNLGGYVGANLFMLGIPLLLDTINVVTNAQIDVNPVCSSTTLSQQDVDTTVEAKGTFDGEVKIVPLEDPTKHKERRFSGEALSQFTVDLEGDYQQIALAMRGTYASKAVSCRIDQQLVVDLKE